MKKPTILVVTLFALSLAGAAAQQGPSKGEWPAYAGDSRGTKYSALSQIAAENVRDLRILWQWPSADREIQASNPAWRGGQYQDTPLMANGTLYTVTPLGMVAALDPASGVTRWTYDPMVYKSGRPNNVGFVHRGLGYWTDGKVERLLLGTGDAYLISVNARTGKPDPAFGDAGRVDLTRGIRDAVRATNYAARGALVAGNVVVVGSSIDDTGRMKTMPPGYVQAFDVRTGKPLWVFHTIPRPGEFGHDTWLDDSAEYSGSTNVWAPMAYDPELEYVYLPISTPTHNSYGGHRLGNNLFAESLVCLEAKTGKRVWHFQTVHHGVWDYDLPAQPVLGDVTVNGRQIKAVMQISKQAFTYVFDRKTGQPIWPIEERPVPQSTVPGERTSPTQPFPTKPPAFDTQGATEENLMNFTPELRQRAKTQLEHYVHGPLFTPPSEKGTIFVPGNLGAASWGGAGFDPETAVLYVPSRLWPWVYRLAPGDPKQGDFRYIQQSPTQFMNVDGLPLFKPPYARVTAIDMNRGEHLWVAPLGNGPRNHPLLRDLNLPPLGDGIHGGSVLVTKTLLFVTVLHLQFGAPGPPAWSQWGDPDAARKVLYVFDKSAGKLLRVVEMEGMAAAAPMTYMHGGKQYVVVASGAGPTSELVALGLPDVAHR